MGGGGGGESFSYRNLKGRLQKRVVFHQGPAIPQSKAYQIQSGMA